MEKIKLKFTVLLLTISLFSYCQKKEESYNLLVKSFFEDVFRNEKSSKVLYNEYAFESVENKKSTNEKTEIFDEHISYLKSQKKQLIKKEIHFKVENYNNCSLEHLLPFDERARKNIFVVIVDGHIESYVLLNASKIQSFNYVQKGNEGPAYFISNF